MAGEWSIEREARRLCGCHACSGMGTPEERCVRVLLEAGIRRGLMQAVAVSREPDMLYVHELRWRLCERYGLPKD